MPPIEDDGTRKKTTVIILEIPEGKHYQSTSMLYNGGFEQLTTCTDCKAIQDYWSNNSSICKYCGGRLTENGIGKWDKKRQKWLCRQQAKG